MLKEEGMLPRGKTWPCSNFSIPVQIILKIVQLISLHIWNAYYDPLRIKYFIIIIFICQSLHSVLFLNVLHIIWTFSRYGVVSTKLIFLLFERTQLSLFCILSLFFFISCLSNLSPSCFRWDDRPRQQTVVHPHQPFSRHPAGAARCCVSERRYESHSAKTNTAWKQQL